MENEIKEELGTSCSLYKLEWVESAADKGYKEFVEDIRKSLVKEDVLEIPVVQKTLAVLYYSSFETALNAFLKQVLEDHLNEIVLSMDELCKVTAEMRKKGE